VWQRKPGAVLQGGGGGGGVAAYRNSVQHTKPPSAGKVCAATRSRVEDALVHNYTPVPFTTRSPAREACRERTMLSTVTDAARQCRACVVVPGGVILPNVAYVPNAQWHEKNSAHMSRCLFAVSAKTSPARRQRET